jgi:hypothetical protein
VIVPVMVADEVGVNVLVTELVTVVEDVGVVVGDGNKLGVIISVIITDGVNVFTPVTSAGNTRVGILVGYGKGFSEELGATKITAVRTTNTKMAPSVSNVRTSQKEYRFIAESPQPQALLS